MRLLFVLRLYSGFESSLSAGVWSPTGTPTIARLLSAVAARGHDVHVLFMVKNVSQISGAESGAVRRVAGLDASIRVVDLFRSRPIPSRLRPYATEIKQTWNVIRAIRELRPAVVYVDRGNVFAGGIVARLMSSLPLVFRVMGITPSVIESLGGRRPADYLLRWLWRSPFAAVICTQDGSGGEQWLDKLLRPSVSRHMLLNGVDTPASTQRGAAAEKVTVLFVGRLEQIKGAREFVDGFLLARERTSTPVQAMIVGSGSLEPELKRAVRAADAEDVVSFHKEVPHADIGAFYARADIYVSLNRQGNLSNANLEAFRYGLCCIVPGSDPGSGRDRFLDTLMPGDALVRIDGISAGGVAEALVNLVEHPDEREARAHRTAALARDAIGSWQERVDKELDLLESISDAPVRAVD